jgi:hypothetical protein
MRDTEDPRLEKLVALLYGELPEAEAREVERWIEADPALRTEWNELTAGRNLLRTWDVPETLPRLVFVNQTEVAARRRRTVGDWFRSVLAAPAWGVAAACATVAVLALAQFRVEKDTHGIALRFGAPPAAPAAPATAPVAYVTQQEMDARFTAMGQAVLAYMDDYGRARDQSMATLLQAALTGMNQQQAQDYHDLRTRIEGLGSGLIENQANTRAQVDYLMRLNEPGTPEHELGQPAKP